MSSEESGPPPVEGFGGSGEVEIERGPFGGQWDRRTLFKGAALGTAAAAMYEGGALFAPLAAFADDLSSLNCTANDVRIPGPGQILNEPCDCPPGTTFDAQVRFRVINNTGTTRYCVTVHFCPGTLPGGGTFIPPNVVIGDVPAKSDAFYTVTIPNYPCGAGLVCFGACGPGTDPDTGLPDCSFPKGTNCPSGGCCTTITWDVNPGCPTKIISSKCRHQQVCIQGRGITTVDCDTSTAGNQSICAVSCGSTATVRVCTTTPADLGPFTFTLDGQSFGPSASTCHDFTVGPITDDTTFTATVTDASGCARTAQVTLTTSAISPTLSVSGEGACDGVLTFSTSVEGFSGCTFTYTIDGMSVADANAAGAEATVNADGTLTFRWLDGNCHTVAVAAACGECEGSDSITVSQCVNTTTNCTP